MKSEVTEKVCCICKELKQADQFHSDSRRNQPQAYCKDCMRLYIKQRSEDRRHTLVLPKTKVCRKCLIEKEARNFTVTPINTDGLHTTCKPCAVISHRKGRNKLRDKDPLRLKAREALAAIKNRSKENDIKVDITLEDLINLFSESDKCPACGVLYVFWKKRALSPSVDRILPNHGYVRNNVQILCSTCNSLKNGMSLEQAEFFVETMRKAARALDKIKAA